MNKKRRPLTLAALAAFGIIIALVATSALAGECYVLPPNAYVIPSNGTYVVAPPTSYYSGGSSSLDVYRAYQRADYYNAQIDSMIRNPDREMERIRKQGREDAKKAAEKVTQDFEAARLRRQRHEAMDAYVRDQEEANRKLIEANNRSGPATQTQVTPSPTPTQVNAVQQEIERLRRLEAESQHKAVNP